MAVSTSYAIAFTSKFRSKLLKSILAVPTIAILVSATRVADKTVREKMGQYQLLGKETQKKIDGSKVAELENAGHMPHIEAFDSFIALLKEYLKG